MSWSAAAKATFRPTRSLPVKSIKDLIALGKAQPGQLAYGTSGAGSTGHIAAELLGQLADGSGELLGLAAQLPEGAGSLQGASRACSWRSC